MTGSSRPGGGARVDPAVALVLLTRLVLLLGAPVTLWLVATRRPPAEQGVFFILWNVQALTQLMELGVGTLIVQFASHESPLLRWNARGGLDGVPVARERVIRAILDGRRWYGRVACALGVLAAVGGVWMFRFRSGEGGRTALVPWLLTVGFTVAYLPLVPFLCAIEGCGGLLRVQRMRLLQSLIAIVVLWIAIVRVGALWGVAAFSFAWLLIAWCWLRVWYRELIAPDLAAPVTQPDVGIGGPPGFIDVQWRTGATWLAWWVAPLSLTPIVLSTQGAVAAGQVGMSFAIATAPLTLAIAWLQARYPQYAALLASGNTQQLGRLARRATIQAACVCTLGAFAAALVVWFIGHVRPLLGSRALPAHWILVLGATNLAWLLVQSLSSYLRAWRQEALMETAVVGAVLIIAGTFVVALRFPTKHVMAAYTLLVVVGVVPLVLVQFRRQLRRTVRVGAEATGAIP